MLLNKRELVICLFMMSLANPENQNSEIEANKYEAGIASYKQCYHKVNQSISISYIKLVYQYSSHFHLYLISI